MTQQDHAPTPEQLAVIDAFRAGKNLVVEAGAGTGKTATLEYLTATLQHSRRRPIYVAYNTAMRVEAQQRFPEHVDCRTSHGLAYRAVGHRFKGRLKSPRQSNVRLAPLLGIDQRFELSQGVVLSPGQLAGLAREAVKRFMQSAHPQLDERHVVPPAGPIEAEAVVALREVVLPAAWRLWHDFCDPLGTLPYQQDAYLKLWQLSEPHLETDHVLFDEAQDANPATAVVLQAQSHAQLVAVGDSNQQLYQWRGAENALASWPADERLKLQQSWRFGQEIADEANRWLGLLPTDLVLKGHPGKASRLEQRQTADAILCRSNRTAFRELIARMRRGERVAMVGDLDDIRRLVDALCALKAGRRTDHPELILLPTWDAVCDHVENDEAGRDLSPIVSLVKGHSAGELKTLLRAAADQKADTAETVVSTAHKSKGRQWNSVIVADDFREPQRSVSSIGGGRHEARPATLSDADAMLAYVAVTRAEMSLDRGGLSWIDRWERRSSDQATNSQRPLVRERTERHHVPASAAPDEPNLQTPHTPGTSLGWWRRLLGRL